MHPYTDLMLGRVDAVLLDDVLAERGVRRNPGSRINRPTSALATTLAISAPENAALRDRIERDSARDAMRDGRLEAIFRRWNMWNDDQPRLYARLLSGEATTAVGGQPADRQRVDRMGRGASAIFRRSVAPR